MADSTIRIRRPALVFGHLSDKSFLQTRQARQLDNGKLTFRVQVPGLYRWLCERYPRSVVDAVETMPQFIGGVRIDPDTSLPNPNGVEYDNLYLDMNGIIHPACHPEDLPAPSNEEEMYLAIFKYIDRVFNIIRPRKLLYMAIDGVAPRAKMNQQRSRRYRSAKEIEDKRAEEERLRDEWSKQGRKLPPKKPPTWDHNVITPGTQFMHTLSENLRFYIHNKLTNDSGWKNVKIILSDASVPGEGEHKVMEFIRLQRQQAGYDPNTRHAIHGKDADLIMLSLATHEPNFSILRELDLDPRGTRLTAEQVRQKHEDEQAMLRLGEADERGPAISCPAFKFIQINIVREYLDLEFRNVPFLFTYDQEQVIDDFVLFCFFAGNDFLPHLPSLDIHEGAIGDMIRIYKENVSNGRIDGYLSRKGMVVLERCGVLLQELGKLEDEIFRRRKQKEDGIAASKARRAREEKDREDARRQTNAAALQANRPSTTSFSGSEGSKASVDPNKAAAAALKAAMTGGVKRERCEGGEADGSKAGPDAKRNKGSDEDVDGKNALAAEEFLNELKSVMEKKRVVEQDDDVCLHQGGWKQRFYRNKFGVDISDPSNAHFPRKVVQSFMEGICWTLLYYYRGCPSWIWFYPFHHAPFASDFVGLHELVIEFPEGTQPFKPFEQLMACLPPLSRHALPAAYQDLMVNSASPIIDFYPKDFKVDMNGKKMAWMGVALLPFIDEGRLLEAVRPLEATLNEQERAQNSRGSDLAFISARDAHKNLVNLLSSMQDTFPLESSPRTETGFGGYINDNLFGLASPCRTSWPLFSSIKSAIPRLDGIKGNLCFCCRFQLPPFVEHIPRLLNGVILPDPVLTDVDTIVEGRRLLDGPPGRGGGGGGRGRGGNDFSRGPTQHVAFQPGGTLHGETPVGRMIAMGLAGPAPGNPHMVGNGQPGWGRGAQAPPPRAGYGQAYPGQPVGYQQAPQYPGAGLPRGNEFLGGGNYGSANPFGGGYAGGAYNAGPGFSGPGGGLGAYGQNGVGRGQSLLDQFGGPAVRDIQRSGGAPPGGAYPGNVGGGYGGVRPGISLLEQFGGGAPTGGPVPGGGPRQQQVRGDAAAGVQG